MRIVTGLFGVFLSCGLVLALSGCAKVQIRETLDSAEEKTLVRWEPDEEANHRLECNPQEVLESGKLEIRVLRRELAVYEVKNATVARETTTRALDRVPNLGAGDFILAPVTWPLSIVAYAGMSVFGFPDSCYGSPAVETVQILRAEGEVRGRTTRWVPAAGVLIRSRINGKDSFTTRSDSAGRVDIDLMAIAREIPCPSAGLTISFRVKKDGNVLEKLEIGPEVAAFLRDLNR